MCEFIACRLAVELVSSVHCQTNSEILHWHWADAVSLRADNGHFSTLWGIVSRPRYHNGSLLNTDNEFR